jgi:hypothetical protein
MNAVSPAAPIPQDDIPFTARDGILETVLDQLTPLYQTIHGSDADLARQAALDAMTPYLQDDRADLAVAGQIVACGLTAMRVFQMCMQPDTKPADLARLCRTADTLSRTEQRYRVTGLYPDQAAAPKPRPPARPVLVETAAPPPSPEPPAAQKQAAPPRQQAPLSDDDFEEIEAAFNEGRADRLLAGETFQEADHSSRNRVNAAFTRTGLEKDFPGPA